MPDEIKVGDWVRLFNPLTGFSLLGQVEAFGQRPERWRGDPGGQTVAVGSFNLRYEAFVHHVQMAKVDIREEWEKTTAPGMPLPEWIAERAEDKYENHKD